MGSPGVSGGMGGDEPVLMNTSNQTARGFLGLRPCPGVTAVCSLVPCSVPKSERTTVHKNLIFALAAAEALLMFSELAKSNQVSKPKGREQRLSGLVPLPEQPLSEQSHGARH